MNNQSTQKIIQHSVHRPLHLLSDLELDELWISSESKWSDHIWQFDADAYGAHRSSSRISWSVEFSDGSKLTDSQYLRVLGWLKRLVWSLLSVPGDETRTIKTATVSKFSVVMKRILPWLLEQGIKEPGDITTKDLERFECDLPMILAEAVGQSDHLDGDGEAVVSISRNSAYDCYSFFRYLWRQRVALEDAGVRPISFKPWPGKSIFKMAKTVANSVDGWIQPIPDEVAVPALNAAISLLGMPFKDIVTLRALLHEAGTLRGVRAEKASNYLYMKRRRAALEDFKFSVRKNESHPWHSALIPYSEDGVEITAHMQLKRLAISLQAAACMVLQGLTGMRASELCSLKAGINSASGLPNSVRSRRSKTGTYEIFEVSGELSKGVPLPEERVWLAGIRRIGDTELPLAVQAIQDLEELLSPYRKLISSEMLLVSIASGGALPTTVAGVAPMTSARITKLYRIFFSRWIDWSTIPDQSKRAFEPNDLLVWKESKGAQIYSHRFRKTYAQYVLAVHHELLPAVQRQFQHANMAMTEEGYWGGSTLQIQAINSISRQMTAKVIYDQIRGTGKLIGRMGESITTSESFNALRERIKDLQPKSMWVEIQYWVSDLDLDISHGPHATCIPVTADYMECWKRAGLRPIGRLQPNYETRNAFMCSGCSSAVIHESHVPYWKSRHASLSASLLQPASSENPEAYREIKRQESNARSVLKHLGINVHREEDSQMHANGIRGR